MTIINFLWDLGIRTDHEIGARRLDLLIVNKGEKSCQIQYKCGNSREWTGEKKGR